jgi:TM2 domain-containing membrane protein YozV
MKCGVSLKHEAEGKDWLTALLLCFFLGIFGIHRFYTGHTTIGVVQLLTLGGCGIWALVDFILIIVGSFKDVQGNLLVKR